MPSMLADGRWPTGAILRQLTAPVLNPPLTHPRRLGLTTGASAARRTSPLKGSTGWSATVLSLVPCRWSPRKSVAIRPPSTIPAVRERAASHCLKAAVCLLSSRQSHNRSSPIPNPCPGGVHEKTRYRNSCHRRARYRHPSIPSILAIRPPVKAARGANPVRDQERPPRLYHFQPIITVTLKRRELVSSPATAISTS